MANNNEDNRINRKRVRGWFRLHCNDYDNSTQGSEACADDLNLLNDDAECSIPSFVFEEALPYFKEA